MNELMNELAMESGYKPYPYSYKELDQRLPSNWEGSIRLTPTQVKETGVYDPREMLLDLLDIKKEINNLARKYGPVIKKYKDWSQSIVEQIDSIVSSHKSDKDTSAYIEDVKAILNKAMRPPVKPLSQVLKDYSYKNKNFSLKAKFNDGYDVEINPVNIPETVEFKINKRELLNLVRTKESIISEVIDLENGGILTPSHTTGWDDPPLRAIALEKGIMFPNIDAHYLFDNNSIEDITDKLIDLVGVNKLSSLLAPIGTTGNTTASSVNKEPDGLFSKLFK